MNKSPIFVGIDYSITSPAICVGDGTYEGSVFHYFGKTKKHFKIDCEKFRVYKYPEYTHQMERIERLAQWAMDIIPESVPVFIESYAFAANGRVFDIAECTGFLKMQLWKRGYTVTGIAPSSMKKIILGKGKGKSKKCMVTEKFIEDYGNDILEKVGRSVSPLTDIIDSFYMIKAGIEIGEEIGKN